MSETERVFVDTNVFIASLTDEPGRGDEATAFLNARLEFYTSLLNLMELRTVLAKKHRIEQERVEATFGRVSESVNIVLPETSDVSAANDLQRETLLYPMDCLVLALAEDQDAPLVTFDAELLDVGAVEPAEFLDRA